MANLGKRIIVLPPLELLDNEYQMLELVIEEYNAVIIERTMKNHIDIKA